MFTSLFRTGSTLVSHFRRPHWTDTMPKAFGEMRKEFCLDSSRVRGCRVKPLGADTLTEECADRDMETLAAKGASAK